MNLEQLRIFVAVAEESHVTRAAGRLNLTQSAVSASVAALERAHGVALFDRVGRNIVPTEAGRSFLPLARAFLGEAEGLRLALEDLAEEVRGHLRIEASQTVASYWLPQEMMAFRARFPKITLRLRSGNSAGVAQAVLEGRADLGFIEDGLAHPGLEARQVAEDELIAVCGPAHPWRARGEIAAEEFPATSWILREEGSGTRAEFAAYLAARDLSLEMLDVALELPSNEAVIAAVAAGRCASVLSLRAAEGALAQGRLIRLSAPVAVRPFSVLTHPQRHRTRAAAAFLSQVGAAA